MSPTYLTGGPVVIPPSGGFDANATIRTIVDGESVYLGPLVVREYWNKPRPDRRGFPRRMVPLR